MIEPMFQLRGAFTITNHANQIVAHIKNTKTIKDRDWWLNEYGVDPLRFEDLFITHNKGVQLSLMPRYIERDNFGGAF